LLDEAVVVWDAPLPLGQRTAQSFAATIDTGLVATGWAPSDIRLVAVTHGPGSFTGLRISVTAAKFFAYATGAAVVAVNTLDVLVEQLPDEVMSACALMDAQRGQFFAAMYTRAADGRWSVDRPCQVLDGHAIAEHLPPHTTLTGLGLAKVPADWFPEFPRSTADVWTPRASQVGLCALRDFQAGVRTDIWQLRPEYYRPSYAEEGGRR
jgi:tRNA threonylcarbamoyladenosine biosynthesis protein TsaB